MTPERIARLRQVLDLRQPDLTLLTDSVHKERNLSAIVRNCDAVGVGHMHCVIPDKEYKSYRGTAKGSNRWVEVQRHLSIEHALLPLKKQGFQVVAAHIAPNTKDYKSIDYCQPTVIVMGSEKIGLSHAAQAICDEFISIPMVGMVESFNVSVASGIILAEAQRQKALAGHYLKPKLSRTEYQRLFFEWGHTKIMRFCQRYKLPYPVLDEYGEIDNPSQWYANARLQIAQNQSRKINNQAI